MTEWPSRASWQPAASTTTLARNGLRNHVGLVVESADPRTVHHFATLVGYGAGAVNPYLAYQTIEDITAGPDGAGHRRRHRRLRRRGRGRPAEDHGQDGHLDG